MPRLFRTLSLSALAGLWLAQPAVSAPDAAGAARLFADAKAICERDNGALWGRSLCGPVFIVDWRDQRVLANQADGEGRLKPEGAMYAGVLDPSVIIANTPTQWAGLRWTQIVDPAPDEADKRAVLIAHELFHRIQPELGMTRPEAANHHLDGFDGRYLLQLEWRALARALEASSDKDRRLAIEDALAFRHERHRLFPEAAAQEGALEVNEGIAEYTGVKLGLTTDAARTAFALHDLKAFVAAPTFVRSFAYATGPAYGLLLDRTSPGWLKEFGDKRFDELLVEAGYRGQGGDIARRAARYDDGALKAAEQKRDAERRARLAELKARLVDGPVLSLPLNKTNYQFNPQTLVALDGFGTVYPTMRLNDDWGSLEVESGGALVYGDRSRATVTAVGADVGGPEGTGWKLTLKPGWSLQPGERPGDLVARKTP